MNKMRMFVFIFIFYSVGCGTDTGNPGFRNSLGGGSATAPIFVDSLINSSCLILSGCHTELSFKRCQLGLFGHSPLVEVIGLSLEVFSTPLDVYEAEERKQLSVEVTASVTCMEEINQLSCENQKVRDAYLEDEEDSFKYAHKLIPMSCGSVYQ